MVTGIDVTTVAEKPQTMLPYSRHDVSDLDIEEVISVLRSRFLTTGPKIAEFESEFSKFVGGDVYAVAVSNGTAALHCAVAAVGVGPGDEVIVPPLTFCSTANSVLFVGGTVKFADIDYDTLCISPASVASLITPSRTKAIIAVDYAGQPADYDELKTICDPEQIHIIADASHSYGAFYKGTPVGRVAHISTFSFHAVKNLTTGEGGMVVTPNKTLADYCRLFRSHGIESNPVQRMATGKHRYEMVALGYNYRITDIQCAIGISQLTRLAEFCKKRQLIASKYDVAFASLAPHITVVKNLKDVTNAYHLYVIRVHSEHFPVSSDITARDLVFQYLRDHQLGVNVHYPLVHHHPYYKNEVLKGNFPSLPISEKVYDEIISFPIFPGMAQSDIQYCIDTLSRAVEDLGA